MSWSLRLSAVAALALASSATCGTSDTQGAGVGMTCSASTPCETGLQCFGGLCVEGQTCATNCDCADAGPLCWSDDEGVALCGPLPELSCAARCNGPMSCTSDCSDSDFCLPPENTCGPGTCVGIVYVACCPAPFGDGCGGGGGGSGGTTGTGGAQGGPGGAAGTGTGGTGTDGG
jgi:hypothetical protein